MPRLLNHVNSLWNSADAPNDEVDLLVYASNLLGRDPRITNFGGGNTSSKIFQTDPLTGESVEVLWVKGSGGDLGTAKKSSFASLYQAKILGLEERFRSKKMHEDEIVPLYPQCTFNLNPAAPSIDTPLHAYVPAPCVSHMHSDEVIAIAAAKDGEALTEKIWGDEMGWLPWKRPGFELGLMLQDLIRANPNAKGAIMGSHGFICWADTWEECYALTLRFINDAVDFLDANKKTEHPFGETLTEVRADRQEILARLLPTLRGRSMFNGQRVLASANTSEAVLDFVNRSKLMELARLGTSCPDHFLRTKIRPLVLGADATFAEIDAALTTFREEYGAYYERCKHADSPAIRNPNPNIVLIPGVGMIAFGKNATEARVAGEFYRNAIAVMKGAESVSEYTALPEQEAFNIEYWLLEEAKLRRQPPEKELSRKVVLLVGGGPGIGKSVADKLLAGGACVVVGDLNGALGQATVEGLQATHGVETSLAVQMDCTNRESVAAAINKAVLHYGGIDAVVNIAAIFVPPDREGKISDAMWIKTYEVNLVGSAIVADEAHKALQAQGTPGSFVLISSANAVVAKKGSVAYDTSKTAVNHLIRELAVEYAPLCRVNGVAPATVVSGSQMFPRDRVIASLIKYEIPFEEGDDDDRLRDRLAQFYAQRTLLKQAVTPERVAEAVYLLTTDRLSQTTGQVISVDAGLADGFLR